MPLSPDELTQLLLDIRHEQAQQAIEIAKLVVKIDTALERKSFMGLAGMLGGMAGAAAAAWSAFKTGGQ